MKCPRCEDRGVLRVQYRSGDAFDLAICICMHGRFWRKAGVDYVRRTFNLSDEHQVGYLEDFKDTADALTPDQPPDFVRAGQTHGKAKL